MKIKTFKSRIANYVVTHLRLLATAAPSLSLFLVLEQLLVDAVLAILADDDRVFAGRRRELELVRETPADFAGRSDDPINRK